MLAILPTLIFWAGAGQLAVLIASAQVPLRLKWTTVFAALPRLHRQLYWVYGGYIVLAITAQGLVSLLCAEELVSGGNLGRAVCGYMALFWGLRLTLQTVLDVNEHLTHWWLKLGYHALTILFAGFTLIYGYAAFGS